MDSHELWRRVMFDYERLDEKAPEGYGPVVDVYLAGRDEPIRLGWVTTDRDPSYPYVRLQRHNPEFPEAEEGRRHPNDLFLHVHEGAILRVEVSYASQSGRLPVGFHWQMDDGRKEETPPTQ
jgi:hypothetical protein